MIPLGTLHLLAPEIPDGISYWRLQVAVSDAHETLFFSDGELRRIRERAAKRPAAALPKPEPMVSEAAYDLLGDKLAVTENVLAEVRADLEGARNDLEAANLTLVETQADLEVTRNDLRTEQAVLADVTVDRDSLSANLAIAHSDLAIERQAAALLRTQVPTAFTPWADFCRAVTRLFGF